jgi:uncharacterized membrane protein YqjE
MTPDDRTPPIHRDESPAAPEKSVGELFNQVATDVGILLSTQIDLAKLELREEAIRAGRAAKLLSIGAVVSWLTVVMLSFAAAWAIGDALDTPALGFLILGVVYGIAAAILLLRGRDRMREVNAVPEQTVATLKDDVAWAKHRAH